LFFLNTVFAIKGFVDIYYLFLTLIFIPLFLCALINRFRPYLSGLLFFQISLIYLYGTYRFSGADYANYMIAYQTPFGGFILEPGINLINLIFQYLGFSFQATMTFIGLVSLYAIIVQARYFSVSVGILAFFYFIHLFIVRDYAQLRVGLGIALFLIAICKEGKFKIFLILVSLTMHFTILFLLFIYLSANIFERSRKQVKFLIFIIFTAVLFLISKGLGSLAFIDPRIEIYLSWNEIGYGASVHSFSQLFFAVFVTMVAFWNYKLYGEYPFIIWTPLFAVVTFIAFREQAIFAFRLTHIALAFYPIILGIAITKNPNIYEKLSIALIAMIAILSRGNVSDLLSRITTLGFF
jgi:hypothetical protein